MSTSGEYIDGFVAQTTSDNDSDPRQLREVNYTSVLEAAVVDLKAIVEAARIIIQPGCHTRCMQL